MRINNEIFALTLIGIGLITTVFTMWQLDIMFVNKMWGSCESNIDFYKGLLQEGYWRWAVAHDFTINYEIFPPQYFTSGFWYDILMMLNILSWFPTVIGVHLLYKKIKYLKSELKRWIQLVGGEEYYE